MENILSIPEATYGYCSTKNEKYKGFKLSMLATFQGIPTEFEFTSANIHDIKVLEKLISCYQKLILVGDKGCLDKFALTLEEWGRRPKAPEERDANYLAWQRRAYRESRKFSGVKMFLEGLKEVKEKFFPRDHSPWFNLLSLLEEREIRKREVLEGSYRLKEGFSAIVFSTACGEVVISLPREWSGDNKRMAAVLKDVLDELREGEIREKVEDYLQKFGGFRITQFQRWEREADLEVLWEMVKVLYSLRGGLTPRELSTWVPTADFEWQLLFLKLNGFVERNSLRRTDVQGREVEVDFYSLREGPPQINLSDLCLEKEFVHTFYDVGLTRQSPIKYVNALKRGGVPPFLEVLLSLTPYDYELLRLQNFPKGKKAGRLVRQFAEAYKRCSE